MAPSELVWQAEDANGWRSTAPWPASGAAGLELRCGLAWLRELRPGAAPRIVAKVAFYADGDRVVLEQLPSGRVQHELPDRCASVRLRWEKAAGRWKLWAEAAGERRVLEATFESPEPQLELCTHSTCVDCFDVCLLPLPGPGALQSPPPAHAELQARIDQLTAELETEKLQKAEIGQQQAEIQQEKEHLRKQLDECKRRYELLTREKEEETQKVESAQHENKALHQRIDSLMEQLETEKLQKAEIQQEKEHLRKQLDECKRRYELLTQEKEEETQKVESAQHEIKALQQRIEVLMEELETEKQQAEITENLQKQLDELAQQKAKEMKQVQDLQQKNETLQQRIALLTQKAQKSKMTKCILQLKAQCDAFLAFSRSDSNDPQAEEGPGATPASEDAVDSFTLVGDQSDMYSDTSSRSAKCFLPNTALHGVDGQLLRVEKLKLGDRVRLMDQTEASVVGMYMHQAKKKPHDLVDLTTRQSRSTVSKSHRVAVPAEGSEGTHQIGHADAEGEACEAESAGKLAVGNVVFVGCKQQKLTKVTSRKEHATLYEVRLDPDGPLEMLQLPSFGLVTFGSLAARSSAPSAMVNMGSVAGSEPADAEMPGSEAEG